MPLREELRHVEHHFVLREVFTMVGTAHSILRGKFARLTTLDLLCLVGSRRFSALVAFLGMPLETILALVVMVLQIHDHEVRLPLQMTIYAERERFRMDVCSEQAMRRAGFIQQSPSRDVARGRY